VPEWSPPYPLPPCVSEHFAINEGVGVFSSLDFVWRSSVVVELIVGTTPPMWCVGRTAVRALGLDSGATRRRVAEASPSVASEDGGFQTGRIITRRSR